MRLRHLVLAATALLLAACGHAAPTEGDVADSTAGMVQGAEEAMVPMSRDVEFMVFLHRFSEDADFQMQHIRFPLGKLSYANFIGEDGDFYPDDFTAKYWCLYDGEYMRYDGAGYFTWQGDERIVFDYNSSLLEELWGEFGTSYTFEKIGGEWYVTGGDYYGSDVGIASSLAQMVEGRNRQFREEHPGPYTPYVYAGTPGSYPQASDRLLTEQDLEGLTQKELRLMRNEIMARHGYAFKSKELSEHFNAQPWYAALFRNVDDRLTDIERANIAMIKSHE